MNDTISHLAGPSITVSGRVLQRCLICGAKLSDSKGTMMLSTDDGDNGFPTWPPGRFIQVSVGQPTRSLLLPDEGERLPADVCEEFI